MYKLYKNIQYETLLKHFKEEFIHMRGGAKTVDNSICIISYDVIFIYKKHQGGIGMFFFLRWISKLHYKIHHNITKKYIWIYMQKTVTRQVRLQQASETRNGMVRRTLQTPPSQSHFGVTFNMFYAGLL